MILEATGPNAFVPETANRDSRSELLASVIRVVLPSDSASQRCTTKPRYHIDDGHRDHSDNQTS
jgi:hypothetical protein